jgi:hypothetical protein
MQAQSATLQASTGKSPGVPKGPIPSAQVTVQPGLAPAKEALPQEAISPDPQPLQGQTSSDPIYHRDHPLLYVRFKAMVPVGIKEPIATWIGTFFGAGAAAQESQHLIQMETNRNKLCMMSECTPETFSHDAFERGYQPACSAYITDLDSLLVKTQGTAFEGGIPNLRFMWQHWLGPDYDRLDTNSLHLELCCVLFNLAAAYSLMGCMTPARLQSKSRLAKEFVFQEHTDVLQYRCRMFKISAILFDNLKKRLLLTSNSVDDITPTIAQMFSSVMLAQAQECFYHVYKEPNPTPAAEKLYASLLVAATSYYNDFLTKYDQLKKLPAVAYEDADEEQPLAPAENIPNYWVIHCSVVRTLLRVNALIHMSRFYAGDVEMFGYRVGYTGKAFVLVDEQLKQLEPCENEKPVEDLLRILTRKRSIAREMHTALAEENRTIYKCTLPSKAEIDALRLTPDSKVVIGDNPDIGSVPLLSSVLKRAKDTFPAILSLASANAWLEYRATRIERMMVHLKGVESHNEILFTVLEHHPEYIFLYFLHHRLLSAVSKSSPIGLYQSKLGAEILSVKNPAVHGQLIGVAERFHPEAVARADRAMNRLRAALASVKEVSQVETIERRVGILEREHAFCTKSQAGQSLEFYRRNKDQYGWIKSSEYSNPLVEQLFGGFKQFLFDFRRPAPASVPAQPKSVAQSNPGLFAALWGPSSKQPDGQNSQQPGSPVAFDLIEQQQVQESGPEQRVAMLGPAHISVALAQLVIGLIDTNFIEREKIEDRLASEMLRNVERKDIELDDKDIVDPSSWTDREISWLMDGSQRIYDHIRLEKELLALLEQNDPGIEIVNEDIALLVRNIIAPTLDGGEPAALELPANYSATPLWTMVRGVIHFKHAKRFASLCKHIEESVEVEAESICRQCDDVVLLARSHTGRGPSLRASSISAGNVAPSVRTTSPPTEKDPSNFYKP